MTKTKTNYYKLSLTYLLLRRSNTFTIMLEELNYQEMSEVKGGANNYCDRLQEIANLRLEDEDYDWDKWADEYEKFCMN